MSEIDGEGLVRRELVCALAALGAGSLMPGPGRAQTSNAVAPFPNRPIRLVVPSAAGGAPDTICRILASELSSALGQPIVVDNKPGAGGGIGMGDVVRAPADGHTLGYGNVVTLAINRALYAKLPYDPDALTGVAVLGSVQNALVVRNELRFHDVGSLIAHARANPGRLSMGSAGNGTTGHLGGELFKSLTGTFIVHVPYRGSPQAIQDLIGGQIDLMFDNLSSIAPHIQGGRVRGLAVSGGKRTPLLPLLPTLQEAGVAGYETTAWGGIVGPKGLPAEVVARLNAEINRILGLPAVRARYDALAFEVAPAAPEVLMAMARAETPRWADVIKRSGAKVD